MRITEGMLHEQSRTRLAKARESVAEAMDRASTGLRVAKPSDDPLAASIARREQGRIARAEATQRVVDAGLLEINAVDSALDSVGSLLARAHELAVQAANVTASREERETAALDVASLRRQIIAVGNTEVNGRYIFAGNIDNVPPFSPGGLYSGDGAVRQLEVVHGLRIPTGVSAESTFGIGVGVDILQTLTDLETVLNANDPDGVADLLGTLQDAHSQVVTARGETGGAMNSFQAVQAAAELTKERATAARSAAIDADPFVSFTDVQRAEQALQAAVAVASQLPFPGLVGGR